MANTAMGSQAFTGNTTGNYNTVIGYSAGSSGNANEGCTFIGTNAGSAAASSFTNSMALGRNATVTGNMQVRIGDAGITSIGGYANWTNLSDIRFKKDVQVETHGLDFVLGLQPITYRLDVNKLNHFLYGAAADTLYRDKNYQQLVAGKEKIVYSGFSAQQVEQLSKNIGYDFSGIQAPQNDQQHYSLSYADFVVPMVKAMQEQQAMIETLKKEVAELKAAQAKNIHSPEK
jgi:trimeric autotransporter adhesin